MRLYADAGSRQGRLHGTLPTTIEPEIFACAVGGHFQAKHIILKPFSLQRLWYKVCPPYREFLVYI